MKFVNAWGLLMPAVLLMTNAISAAAQPAATVPVVTTPPTTRAIGLDKLRMRLIESYAKGDVESLLTYLDPNVVIIFPNGQLVEGRDNLLSYINRMLRGPDAIVERYTNAPEVLHRELSNDVAVSHGLMNDHYVLKDGRGEFDLGSRFTVIAARLPNGPADTDGWVVKTFHQSTNAFENPATNIALNKGLTVGAISGFVVGLSIGTLGTLAIRRLRTSLSRKASA